MATTYYIIATEKDAIDISGSIATITDNLCCTKSRAGALGCYVQTPSTGAYKNNELVQKLHLVSITLETPIIELLIGQDASQDTSWKEVGTGYSYIIPATGGTFRVKTVAISNTETGESRFTLYDTVNKTISCDNLSTTYNASTTILGTRTASGEVLGIKVSGETVTFYKSANLITPSFVTLPTWSDIPASGGDSTLSNTPKIRLTFSTGEYIDLSYNTATYGTWTVGTASADDLETTIKARTAIKKLTVKYTLSSSYGSTEVTSNSVQVYLAANVRTLSSVYLSPYLPDSSWIVTVTKGNWNTVPASGGYLKTMAYANYTHTSGTALNDQKITDDASLSWSAGLDNWITEHSNGGYYVASRGTTYGTARSSTGTYSYTYSGVTKTTTKSITQAANTYTDAWNNPSISKYSYTSTYFTVNGGTTSAPTVTASQSGIRTFASGKTADITNATFTYSYSSNSTDFTVANDSTKLDFGKITAEENSTTSKKSATITVTVTGAGNKTAIETVSVWQLAVGYVILSKTSNTIYPDQCLDFTVTSYSGTLSAVSSDVDSCSCVLSGTKITYCWESADSDTIITVSAAGSDEYTAASATFTAYTRKNNLDISISGDNPVYNGTSTLTLSGNSGSGVVTWKSSNSNYVSVSRNGSSPYNTAIVTGVSCGQNVTITASVAETSKYYENSAIITISTTALTASLKWGELSWIYDDSEHYTTCSVNNLVGKDVCTVGLSGNSITTVGTTTVTATSLSNSNYKLPSLKSETLEITARPIEYTADDLEKTYDGSKLVADNTTTLTSGSLVSEHKATFSCTGERTNAGSSTKTLSSVTIKKADGTDVTSLYSIIKTDGKLTVNKAATASASNVDRTYNGAELTGVTGSYVSWSGTTKATNAGEYTSTTYTAYATPDSNHTWEDGTTAKKTITWTMSAADPGTLTVDAYTGTWSGSAQGYVTAKMSKTIVGTFYYGTTSTANTYNVMSSTTATDLSSITRTAAGITTVYVRYVPANTNYLKRTGSANLTVNKATTASASALSPTYSGSLQTGVTGSYVTWTGTTKGTDAGDYTAYATPDSNHTWSNGTSDKKTISWTMTQKAVTITYNPVSWTYDGSAHSTTSSISGVVSGDTCTVTLSNNSVGKDVGSATVTASISNDNYYIKSGASTTISITQKTASLEWGTVSWTYDGSSHKTTCSVNNLISGDTCTVTLSDNSVGDGVGTQTVTATKLSNSNYALPSSTTNTLTISKRSTTVTGGSKSKLYDGSALTYTYATASNLISSNHLHSYSISGSQTYVGSSNNTPSSATIYNGTHSGTESAVTTNYSISYANGTLTVTKGTPNLTVTGVDKTYTGTSYYATVSCSNCIGTFYWKKGSAPSTSDYTGTVDIAAKNTSYNITSVKDNSDDFTLYYLFVPSSSSTIVTGQTYAANFNNASGNKSLTISPRDISNVSMTATAATYNGTELTATVIITDTGGTIATSDYTITGNKGTTAGDYTITATAKNNYTGTKTCTWTINKRSIEIKPNDTSKTYDGSKLEPSSASGNNFASTDHLHSYTLGGSLTSVGSSDSTVSNPVIYNGTHNGTESDVSDNYSISCKNGKLTVTAKSVSYKAKDLSKAYDGTVLSATNTADLQSGSLVSGHTATFSCTGSLTTVGSSTKTLSSVTIKSGTTDVSSNYDITKTDGTLKVTLRTVIPTAPTATNRTYNTLDQTIFSIGSCTAGGTMYYSASNSAFNSTNISNGTWSTSLPYTLKKAAGTYTIYWYCYVSDTTNNLDTSTDNINVIKSVSATISNKSISIPTPTDAGGQYKGSAYTATFGACTGASITKYRYSTDKTNWTETTSNPGLTNVGTLYTLAYYTALTNYTGSSWSSSATITVTVNTTPTLSVSDPAAQTYKASGTYSFTLEASVSGGGTITYPSSITVKNSSGTAISGWSISGSTVTVPLGTGIGSYTVTGNISADKSTNYSAVSATSKNWTITISKRTFNHTSPKTCSTYDGATHNPGETGWDGTYMAYTGTWSTKTAGNYTYTVYLKDKNNTSWTDGTTTDRSYSWSIYQREVTLSWGTTSWPYDGSEHSTTCTAGNLVSEDTCTVTLSGNSIKNAGSTTVTASALSNSNYKLPSTNTTTLTVSQITPTLSVSNPSALTYKTSGTYSFTLGASVTGEGTITYPSSITVKNGTTTVTGWSISGSTVTVPAGTNAGSYTITGNISAAKSTNYVAVSSTSKSWTITISKATPTVTWSCGLVVYPSTAYVSVKSNVAGTFYETYNGTVLTDSNYSTSKLKTLAVSANNAGNIDSGSGGGNSWTISVYFVPTDTTNYKNWSTSSTKTLSISKRLITITGKALSVTYGNNIVTSFTTSNYSTYITVGGTNGLYTGHTVSGTLTGKNSSGTAYTTSTSVTSGYYVVPSGAKIYSGSTEITSNYSISYTGITGNGALTINKATPTLTISAGSSTYPNTATASCKANVAGKYTYGASSGATTYNSGSTAIAANTSYSFSSMSRTSSSNAGTTNIYFYFTPSDTTNYNSVTGQTTSATIKKAGLSLSISGSNPTYGGTSTLTLSGNTGNGAVTWTTSSSTYVSIPGSNATSAVVKANACGQSVTITAAVEETTNYNYGSTTKTITPQKASGGLTVSLTNRNYSCSEQTVASASNNTGTYYLGFGSSSTSAPSSWTNGSLSKTDPGTYYVWYKVDSSTNYNAVSQTYKGSVKINNYPLGTPTVTQIKNFPVTGVTINSSNASTYFSVTNPTGPSCVTVSGSWSGSLVIASRGATEASTGAVTGTGSLVYTASATNCSDGTKTITGGTQDANVKTFSSVTCTVSGSSNIPTSYVNLADWIGAAGGTLTLGAYATYSYTTGSTSTTDVSTAATYSISSNVSINNTANAVTISGRTITVPTRGTVTGSSLYPKFKATWNSKTSAERACGILYNLVESETDTSNSNYTGTVSIGSGLGAGATSATVTASAYHTHAYKNLYTSGSKDASYKYSYPSDTCYISLSSANTTTKTSGRWTLSSNSSGATLSHSTMGTTLGSDSITVYVYNGSTRVNSTSSSVTNSVTKVTPYATSTSHVMYSSSSPVGANGTTSASPSSYNGTATYTFSSGSTTNDSSTSPSFGGTASYSRTYSNYDSVFSVNSSGLVTATSRGTSYSTSLRTGNITAKLVVTYTHPSGYSGGTVTSSTLTLYPTVYLAANTLSSLLITEGSISYSAFSGTDTLDGGYNYPTTTTPTVLVVFSSGSRATASSYGSVSHSYSYTTTGSTSIWYLNSSNGAVAPKTTNVSASSRTCQVTRKDSVTVSLYSSYGGGILTGTRLNSATVTLYAFGGIMVTGSTTTLTAGMKIVLTYASTSGSYAIDLYKVPSNFIFEVTSSEASLGYKVILTSSSSCPIVYDLNGSGTLDSGTSITSGAYIRANKLQYLYGRWEIVGTGSAYWAPGNSINLGI